MIVKDLELDPQLNLRILVRAASPSWTINLIMFDRVHTLSNIENERKLNEHWSSYYLVSRVSRELTLFTLNHTSAALAQLELEWKSIVVSQTFSD